mmetsp:Transcript_27989/g.60335  ORF Transcript_27989/g.60335 Transcript_27989/m.60335 type:complete len:246 (-) Transcript_27989:559-1296(-)
MRTRRAATLALVLARTRTDLNTACRRRKPLPSLRASSSGLREAYHLPSTAAALRCFCWWARRPMNEPMMREERRRWMQQTLSSRADCITDWFSSASVRSSSTSRTAALLRAAHWMRVAERVCTPITFLCSSRLPCACSFTAAPCLRASCASNRRTFSILQLYIRHTDCTLVVAPARARISLLHCQRRHMDCTISTASSIIRALRRPRKPLNRVCTCTTTRVWHAQRLFAISTLTRACRATAAHSR